MIENDLNESLSQLRMISPDDDSSARHAPVTAKLGREEMRSPLNWTRHHQNLNETRQRSAIKSDFSLLVFISCVEPIVRDMQLGVITKILTMSRHMSAEPKSCFTNQRHFRQIFRLF